MKYVEFVRSLLTNELRGSLGCVTQSWKYAAVSPHVSLFLRSVLPPECSTVHQLLRRCLEPIRELQRQAVTAVAFQISD